MTNIFCVRALGQPMTQCEFGIARAGGGYPTVLMTKPDGRTHAIFLRMGKTIGADASEAEGNVGKFGAAREDDRNLSWVDSERDEIAGAVGSRARLKSKSSRTRRTLASVCRPTAKQWRSR